MAEKKKKKKEGECLPSSADSNVLATKKKKSAETSDRNVPSEQQIPTAEAISMDTMTPLEVEQDDTVFAIATTYPEEPLEVSVEGEPELRVLRKVPISELPLRCQRLLLAEPSEQFQRPQNGCDSVEYIPGNIPSYDTCLWIAGAGILFCFTLLEDDVPPFWPSFISALLIIISAAMAIRIANIRKPLYAKDSRGIQKPYPGDWNGGVYLVGYSGLLQYDPATRRAWWFPVHSICAVDINEQGAGKESFWRCKVRTYLGSDHVIGELAKELRIGLMWNIQQFNKEKEWFLQIQRWHQDCSAEKP